ncbi:MAG: hypothetical protein WCT12_28245 [Verrucomicrobiota bacterium]
MKMKQMAIGICVGTILGCWVGSGTAKAEVFAKGSPVQILTSDKAVAGKLETDSTAKVVKVATADNKTVAVRQGKIKEIRLLTNCGPKALEGKVEEARTRGSGDFTTQFSSAYESYFTDRDVRKSDGTLTSLGQVVLDQLHPTATFVGVSVHDVKITYRGENLAKDWQNLQRVDLRLTLRWKGWGIVTDDGWTKVAMTFDKEVGRWARVEALDTNGVKNTDIWKTAAQVAITALVGLLTGGSN